MPKKWDDLMKLLARENPQALVSFLLGDAVYEGEIDQEVKSISVFADLLYTVTWNNEKIVLHVEFQHDQDPDMGKRVWQYNTITTMRVGLPVYSVVIYLVKENSIAEPPYIIQLRNGIVI